MSRYQPVNLQQDAFVPIRFDRQILPDTFEFTLHHLLEHQVDLTVIPRKTPAADCSRQCPLMADCSLFTEAIPRSLWLGITPDPKEWESIG